MSRLMQLPSLYGVRGSIATQTMANLTEKQVAEVDRIVRDVVCDQALAADKFEFIKQLGHTIQGDYKSDRSVAEHEFYIAVWRATVYLLYHREYTYYCTLCGHSEYNTSTSKCKTFDRQYNICPYCKGSLLNGKIVYLKKEPRGYRLIDADGAAMSERYAHRIDIEKMVQSPVKTTLGGTKIIDPHKMLEDADQKGKWYSVWVWNYFRQILNENIIKTHNKHQTQISGPANTVATCEFINELRHTSHKYHFDESTLYHDESEIITNTASMGKEWVAFCIAMRNKYKNYGVCISDTWYSIKIESNDDDVPIVEATIVTEDPVIMISLTTPRNGEDGDDNSWTDIVESNATAGAGRFEKTEVDLDEGDWIGIAHQNLPDEVCSKIFDIYMQRGDAWDDFSAQFKHREAAKSHLAKYFNITIKQIDEYRQIIAEVCKGLGIGYGKAYSDDDIRLPQIQRGEFVIVAGRNQFVAHVDTECPYLLLAPKFWNPRRVIGLRHKFVKVEGHDKLIKVCDHCMV